MGKLNLAALVAATIADSVIDTEEAKELRNAIYADGTVDKEEANALFQINDAVSGSENSEDWNTLFVEALSDYVLKDENTPGVVDQEEGEYLYSKINNDGTVDANEIALLQNIKDNATEIKHEGLQSLIDAHCS